MRAEAPSPLSPLLSPLFDQQIFDRLLPQRESRLGFEDASDFLLIGPLVGLGAGAVHGGPLAAVEHAELDAGGVDGPAHGAAQGVDLADDLPLAHAADGRIAAHQGDGVEVAGQQRGFRAHPRRGQRRLGAGMAAADHQDVEMASVPIYVNHTECCGNGDQWTSSDNSERRRYAARSIGPAGHSKLEQPEKLFLRQAELAAALGAGENDVEQLALLLQHAVDPLLDRVEHEKARDGDRAVHADAMGAVDRLVLDGRIPPAVEQETRSWRTEGSDPTPPAP